MQNHPSPWNEGEAVCVEINGVGMVEHYGDPAGEYAAGTAGAGLYAAGDRGVIEVTGVDRAAWLNNLVTNTIKTLTPGEGNYAFATNIKGRILADFNMLVLPEAIRLDIDRRLIPKMLDHFNRYLIAEQVTLTDRSEELIRIALLGPKSQEIAEALGAAQAGTMASLGSTMVPLRGKHRLMVRHDFAGVLGLEFHIEAADGADCWSRLLEIGSPVGLRPVGRQTVRTLRIEAGIPAYGEEIDEEVLPAETLQVERGISYVKGCYLGQEVVERMRSHGSLARQLVGVRLRMPTREVQPPLPMFVETRDVGRLMSVCDSPGVGATIGLGYLRPAYAKPGTPVAFDAASEPVGEVAALPFRQT